ncbi:MAG: hypothetical protein EON59_07625 [Alphaproteobacteria bacterium]|nr:MAG: hypothetical protein EON59_07625 [Alphaproteobacteria bacterium]
MPIAQASKVQPGPERDRRVRQLYDQGVPVDDIAQQMGLSDISSVKRIRARLGLAARRELPPGRPWTDQEDQVLARSHKALTNDQLSVVLDRTRSAVAMRLSHLGLRRRGVISCR